MLTPHEYYDILGLSADCTTEEIKRAYREKARQYHPDINHTPGSKDLFILATEAYEFLLVYKQSAARQEEEFNRAMEDWRKYRQARTRQKANIYARTSYSRFTNTKFYKTTRIYDGARIIFSMIIAVGVLVYSVFGYIFRLQHPLKGEKPPTFWNLSLYLLLGLVLFLISFIFLKAHIETYKKRKKR